MINTVLTMFTMLEKILYELRMLNKKLDTIVENTTPEPEPEPETEDSNG